MTVLSREKTASGLDERSAGLGSYFVVGVAALAIGVFGALGIQRMVETGGATAAQNATALRASEVGANLDSLWQVGVLQQAAIDDAALLQSRIDVGYGQYEAIANLRLLQQRIEAGILQQAAIEAAIPKTLLEQRMAAGLLQQAAIDAATRTGLLQQRIEAGILQQAAIDAANADWTTRWSEADEHIDALVAAGLAQQEFYSNR